MVASVVSATDCNDAARMRHEAKAVLRLGIPLFGKRSEFTQHCGIVLTKEGRQTRIKIRMTYADRSEQQSESQLAAYEWMVHGVVSLDSWKNQVADCK